MMTKEQITEAVNMVMDSRKPRPVNVIQDDITRVSASLESKEILTDRQEREQFLRDLQMELCLAWIPLFIGKIKDLETRINQLEDKQ